MTSTIKLTDVKILENRQRQEFDPEALQELKTSIEDRGLLHPPVLRQVNGEFVLAAGERRLRAIQELFELGGEFRYGGQLFTAAAGLIPYTDLGELDELEAEEVELDENLKRRDLTWQEQAAAIARLHALRDKQKSLQREAALANHSDRLEQSGVAVTAIPSGIQTFADTAEELTGRRDGSYQDSVRTAVLVAKHLDNPAVAKASTAKEALKILKKEEERARNIMLAQTVGASFNADKHQCLNVNCLDWMALPENAGKFDVILTDPPYGMGADKFSDGGGKLSGITHHYDDSYESWQILMESWCQLAFQVTAPEAHAYVFCDFDRFHELKGYMERAGWYVFRTPFVVHKLNSGRVPLPQTGPRRQYELVLYAIKGNKPVTNIYPDVIPCKGDEATFHGANKPVELYQNLLQRSVRPGDKVLDAFCGSGPIFPAAHTFKCEATGLELDVASYGLSLKRLQEVKQNDHLGLVLGV